MVKTIPVLIVDDSVIRSTLVRLLPEAGDIAVVGAVRDPFEVRQYLVAHRPSVIVLGSLAQVDSLTFLKKLMASYHAPVILCPEVSPMSSRIAMEAVEAGAVDVVHKPLMTGGNPALRKFCDELIAKIRTAVLAKLVRPTVVVSKSTVNTSFREAGLDPSRYLVLIGASTGGTEALQVLLDHVPSDFPATAIVQHMPEGFTESFAGRLNQTSELIVTEAVQRDLLIPGRAFLARGGIQMMVHGSGSQLRLSYGTSELVNRHCPSVDVLFDSAARSLGRQVVGVILTGMGEDGARGLLKLRQAGAVTFGQDSASCVVYGMPKAAFELGGVEQQAPPAEIPRLIVKALQARLKDRPTLKGTFAS